jgi:hypothetical protein
LIAFNAELAAEKNRQTLEILKLRRTKQGKWRGFPFYFTLLWLTELPDSEAHEELDYVRDYSGKLSKRPMGDDQYTEIRRKIINKALNQ